MPDLNRWIIPAVLGVVIAFLFNELRRGLREGAMYEITKRRTRGHRQNIYRRDSEPIGFWALFGFYVLAVIASLAPIGVVIWKAPSSWKRLRNKFLDF